MRRSSAPPLPDLSDFVACEAWLDEITPKDGDNISEALRKCTDGMIDLMRELIVRIRDLERF